MRSPCPPPGARRASFDRRSWISAIASPSPRSACSNSTSSPTASLSPPCFRRPRSELSYTAPSAPSTRQTPPVPDNTVPLMPPRVKGDSFVPHRVPPLSRRLVRRVLADQVVEQLLHRAQAHGPDRLASGLLGGPICEVVGLEVTLDALRPDAAPAEKQEVGAERASDNVRLVDHDLDAVGHSIGSLERGRARVHGRIAADRVRVPTCVVGREEST